MSLLAAKENEFVLRFANVNGTGSASANFLVARTIFRMGVPIGPKNMFPSNIQGLPTWFEIRVSEKGYTARRGGVDLFIAFNAETFEADCNEVVNDGFVLYDSTRFIHKEKLRAGINFLPIPIAKMAQELFSNPKERLMMQNMIYVGVLCHLLRLSDEIIVFQLEETYKKHPVLLPLNQKAINAGKAYAKEHFSQGVPFFVKATKQNENKILLEGNEALALGALYAGATVCGWYPITPSSSVVDYFSKYCAKFRIDKESSSKKYAIVQAEDEISSIGIVLGACWNGARAFTATSGPGISLMTEFLGYAYYAEIPAVIFNIQRCGPSTGMPTRTQQADLLLCAYASHGDTEYPILFPSNPLQCFEMSVLAFDLADLFQTPVFVLSDLEIAMNSYLCDELTWNDSYRHNRGKVLDQEELNKRTDPFYRYDDKDKDGICYRTYPGIAAKGSYFTRGSGHDRFGRYTESGELYQENLDRLARKFATLKEALPKPQINCEKNSEKAVIAYGSSVEALKEALDYLRDQGTYFDLVVIKAYPFPNMLADALAKYKLIVVVEQNQQGQMRKLLLAQEMIAKKAKCVLLPHYSGLPLEASFLVQRLKVIAAENLEKEGAHVFNPSSKA